MKKVAKGLSKLVLLTSKALNRTQFEEMLVELIQRRLKRLPAAEGLRLLLGLDASLYAIQGELAVEYGGGQHTKHKHTGYHNFFIERIKEGERVLDVGCGVGAVAHDVVIKSGAKVTGIDLSAENIAEAKRRFLRPDLSFRVEDALNLTPDNAFDVILLSNVLEHIEKRVPFLKRIGENTRAKRFLIRVPLFERDWRVPLKKELGVEWRLDPDHKTEYTLESFAAEMAEAGLEIKHLEVRWGEIWSELAAKQAG